MEVTKETATDGQELTASSTSGSLLAMRVWLAGSPWRLTGAWLVLAGLTAVSGLRVTDQLLVPLLLTVFLADPIWNALWSQVAERSTWQDKGDIWHLRLPYATASGPASHPRLQTAVLRDVVPLVAVALLVAWILGTLSLALTVLVLVVSLLGWLSNRAGQTSMARWLHTLVLVPFPFILGVALVSAWPDSPQDLRLAGLALGCALYARAGLALDQVDPAPLWLATIGTVVVVAVLLSAGLPLAATAAGLLATGPLLVLARSPDAGAATLQPWWLAAGLVSAFALGLGIG